MALFIHPSSSKHLKAELGDEKAEQDNDRSVVEIFCGTGAATLEYCNLAG